MKKLLILFFILGQIPAFAQDISWNINLDDTINANLITISPDSVWQIGTPNKVFFDSAFSIPNAIVTKLDTVYPSNTNSYFEMKFPNPFAIGSYFGAFGMSFISKYDLDSLHSGRWISISVDNGLTFHSSSFEVGEIYHNNSTLHLLDDTLFNGELGLTGKSDFDNELFSFQACIYSSIDTFIVRFNMASDSTPNTIFEGWLIDNIRMEFNVCEKVEENKAINFSFNYTSNSDPNYLNLTIDNPKENYLQVKVTDLLGKTIIQKQLVCKQGKSTHLFSVQDVNEGLYIISVTDGNSILSKKIVIN